MHRVVVTGFGCISAAGHSPADHWAACRDGRSGIGTISRTDPEPLIVKICAEVRDFDPAQHFDDRQLTLLDRVSQFAVYAGRQAVADAKLSLTPEQARRTAVIVGTGAGGMETVDASYYRVYKDGRTRVMPLTVPRLMISAATSHISMDQGVMGPAFAVSSACSSTNHAIGEAFSMIRSGRAVAAICGGTEASLTYRHHARLGSVAGHGK